MRVSTKICLEKEKKTHALTKNKEKNPLWNYVFNVFEISRVVFESSSLFRQ